MCLCYFVAGVLLLYYLVLALIEQLRTCQGDVMTSSASSSSSVASKALVRKLSDSALSKLTATGSLYPTQFRAILQQHPHMRGVLEAAVLAQKQAAASAQEASSKRAGISRVADENAEAAQKPSIKLKMDFSNFKS